MTNSELDKYRDLPFSILILSDEHKKLLKEISSLNTKPYFQIQETIGGILDLDPDYFSGTPSIGQRALNSLATLKEKLLNEDVKHLIHPSEQTASNKTIPSEISEIDTLLIEDINNFLDSLDDRTRGIAVSRWGFNSNIKILEELGITFNVTRERIRQIQEKTNLKFPESLSIKPNLLLEYINNSKDVNLQISLPKLFHCFNSEKSFYSFIELCCQVDQGSLTKLTPNVSKHLLEPYFCSNISPVHRNVLINEISSAFGFDDYFADVAITKLIKMGSLKETSLGLKPQNMPNKEAIAHTLTFHPEGFHWKIASMIANVNGYSRNKISEQRLSVSYSDSDYSYLCTLGTYRNIKFLNLSQFNIDDILKHLYDYIIQHKLESLILNDYYQKTINEHDSIDYYTLRYIVKNFGESCNLFFDGRSQIDNVSIIKNSSKITQEDLVLKTIKSSDVPVSKYEIAQKLKSKSVSHALLYLNNLINDDKIIRYDKVMYTTADKVFNQLPLDEIFSIIKDIVIKSNRIIEVDTFREEINNKLKLYYSKYFYSALIDHHLDELGLYKYKNFVDSRPIDINRMRVLLKSIFKSEESDLQNLIIINKEVLMTKSILPNTMKQLKSFLKL